MYSKLLMFASESINFLPPIGKRDALEYKEGRNDRCDYQVKVKHYHGHASSYHAKRNAQRIDLQDF